MKRYLAERKYSKARQQYIYYETRETQANEDSIEMANALANLAWKELMQAGGKIGLSPETITSTLN